MPYHQDKTPEITFVIPEFMMGVGGIEMLVLNLSRAVAEAEDCSLRCRVICPRGSFVHEELRMLASKRIRILHWEKNVATGDAQSLLVCWGGLGSLQKLRGYNPRILVWTVMPGQMFAHLDRIEKSFPLFGFYIRKIRTRIAHYLATTSGVVHMDRTTKFAFEQFTDVQTDEGYLPIPIQVRSNQFLENLEIATPLRTFRVSWVGRSSTPWKIIPLVRFFEDAILPDDGLLKLTVFTDAAEPYRILFEARSISNTIEIVYEIGVVGDTLRDRLAREFHLHLAMGTSVLEGAAVGTPSLCLNPQDNIDHPASWQWLYEKQEADLGDFNAPESTKVPFDFQRLVVDSELLKHYSSLCYGHASLNHDITGTLSRLLSNRTTANLNGYLRTHGVLGIVFRIFTSILARIRK